MINVKENAKLKCNSCLVLTLSIVRMPTANEWKTITIDMLDEYCQCHIFMPSIVITSEKRQHCVRTQSESRIRNIFVVFMGLQQ